MESNRRSIHSSPGSPGKGAVSMWCQSNSLASAVVALTLATVREEVPYTRPCSSSVDRPVAALDLLMLALKLLTTG